MVGKFGKRHPNTYDPIHVSSSPSDHKNPRKKLKESSTRESKPAMKIDYDPGDQISLKIQSARNHFKLNSYVGLIVMNPTQLERVQTDIG
jgi:hypothetical protein